MQGDLAGDYFPLNGSRSYAPKPNGMSLEKEEELRKCGNLFQEPDSTLLLASGMGRHWPDARGVFHNFEKTLFVWFGEEDHLRIVSMQGQRSGPTIEGKDIRGVTARFMRACDAVQQVLMAEGFDFMHDPNLGWILTSIESWHRSSSWHNGELAECLWPPRLEDTHRTNGIASPWYRWC